MPKPYKIIESFIIENALVGVVQQEQVGGKSLVCRIEAIHAGVTKNFSMYSAEELRNSLASWTTPYNKPVLTHHNVYSGEPIGRVLAADYKKSPFNNRDCHELTVKLTDAEAIAKILDGRYITVSVGGIAESATCSVCGANWAEEACEHVPGQTYDGVLCTAILHGIDFLEVSFVNAPADEHAKVVGLIQEAYLCDDENARVEKVDKPGLVLLQEADARALLEKFQLKDQQPDLKAAHERLHSSWRDDMPEDKRQELALAHQELVVQMGGAGVEHQMINALDELLPDNLKPQPPEVHNEQQPADYQALVAALAAAARDKQQLAEEIQALKDSLGKNQDLVVTMNRQLDASQKNCKALQAEKDQLLEANTQLAAKVHAMLVDQVLAAKVAAGKLQPADVDGVREEYLVKTDTVLEELLAELKQEAEAAVASVITVPNPTLPVDDEEVKTGREQALFSLFRGLGRN